MRLQSLFLPLLSASLLASSILPAVADTRTERRSKPQSAVAAAAPDRSADAADQEPHPEAVRQVIELTNRERLKAGLPALKRQKCLLDSAAWLARDMAERHYFDHHDSGGRSMTARLTGFKYTDYSALGENIAMGQRTPQEVVACWMNSPGHRANILCSDFSEIGVGYVPASAQGSGGYWVQDFGSRFDRCQIVIDTDAARTKSPRVKLSIHGNEWVEKMRFSNDGTHWTDWEAFRPLRDWSLDAGPGRRTVHIEVRQAGRVERLEAAVLVDDKAE